MNITQVELAELLNVNQVTIANYEKGIRFPRKDILIKLTAALGISLDTLIEKSSVPRIISHKTDCSIEEFLNILLMHSITDAERYVRSWQENESFTQEDVYNNIFIPLLRMTGKMWFSGDLLISQEHLITNKIRELVMFIGLRAEERTEYKTDDGKRWMGLCSPGEEHDLALLMNSQVMCSNGWKTYFLGKNIPFQDLRRMIELYSPKILAISTSMNENLKGLVSYVAALREIFGKNLGIICGGNAAVTGNKSISGMVDGIAGSIEEGRDMSEKILISMGEN